jgi:hypothetical protein
MNKSPWVVEVEIVFNNSQGLIWLLFPLAKAYNLNLLIWIFDFSITLENIS